MEDVRPSVPRTPTQAVLRIVSLTMALIGAIVLVGGVVLLVGDSELGIPSGDVWMVATFGVILLVVAGLLLLTAVLGMAASDNSARVGPYRFLCYLVGLVVLVAIVWGWGMGTFILFNPVVLTTTIVYVLVCSTLADKVQEEHDHGVHGEMFLRSRHQRSLHLFAEVLLVKGAMTAVVVGVLLVAMVASGEGTVITFTGVDVQVDSSLVAIGAIGAFAALVDLGVGLLGIWGSNRPFKIKPFFVVSVVAVTFDVVRAALCVAFRGLAMVPVDLVVDALFMGLCALLAWKIMRQPPMLGAVNEILATSSELLD